MPVGQLAVVEECLPLEFQGLGVLGFGGQAAADLFPQGIGLEEEVQAVPCLRNHLALVTDEVAGDFTIPRLRRLHDLSGVEVDCRHFRAA